MRKSAIVLLLASAFASSAAPKPGKIYRGSYFHNFETSAFTLAGSDEQWCVNSAEMAKAIAPASTSGSASVVVRGELSPEGKYCNLGAYKHMLNVYEVISVSNVRSSK